MYAVWENFVSGLRRVPPDAPFGKLADQYVHIESGAVYEYAGKIGKGRYGRVDAYRCSATNTPCPNQFAVKSMCGNAEHEILAIHALSAISTVHPKAGGFVQAAILRESGDGSADVAMPVYNGDLCAFSNACTSRFAVRATLSVSMTARALWRSGLAYCDVKTSNVLYHSKNNENHVVLGDLGSIVLRRSHDGSHATGIFTFPPRRSVDTCGIVVPIEEDIVWGLGTLLMTLTLGVGWVAHRLTADALQLRCAGDLEAAFIAADADVRAAADEMRAEKGAFGVKAANALLIALDAWAELESASLTAFCDVLR